MLSINSEVSARVGAVTTGVSTSVAFVDVLDPYVKFAAGVVALLVGVATLAYYTLAALEKWRSLRK